MSSNPLEDDPARESRIRERAYHLWKADGEPQGRDAEYWERARELVGMADSAGAAQMSPTAGAAHRLNGQIVDEAALEENLGEFPGRQTDQGDRKTTPARKTARPAAKAVLPVTKAAAPAAKTLKKAPAPPSEPEAPVKPAAKAVAKRALPAKKTAAPASKGSATRRKLPMAVAPEPEPVKSKAKSKKA